MNKLFGAAVFSLLALPLPALGSTMTFSGLQAFDNSYSEDGIHAKLIAEGSGPAGGDAFGSDFLLMNDFHDREPNKVEFTMATAFKPVSFVYSGGTSGWTLVGSTTLLGIPNVVVRGYVGSTLAYFDTFFAATGLHTYAFSNVVTALDSVSIHIVRPDYWGASGEVGCNGYEIPQNPPCASIIVDDVVLAPVPLPASLPLLASCLAGIAIWRRRVFRQRPAPLTH